MADGSEPPKKLEREKALELARKGMDAWNEWAEAHPGWEVDFSGHDFTDDPISFAKFVFPGRAHFDDCVFRDADFIESEFRSGAVWFSGAQFTGAHVWFIKTKFNGGVAWFDSVDFSAAAWFGNAVFEYEAVFAMADLGGAFLMNGATFKRVPDFRYTNPARHLTLHGIDIKYCTSASYEKFFSMSCSKALEAQDVDKFRRLKEFAINTKDHDQELKFFASELRAKRFYEVTDFGGLAWGYLYEWLSDFGRSTWRPIAALLVTWFCSGFIYWMTAQWAAVGPLKSVGDGLKLSASVLVPFVAAARTSYEEAKGALYGADTGLWLDLVAIFEGILGLAFVFLIGLALRNRFRI